MKKLLLSLLLLITTLSFGQNLSLTQDITLPEQGGNCGNGPTTDITYDNVNLNGFTITLRSTNFKVLSYLNGPGNIIQCGNQNHSTVCISGVIQNNPNLNGLSCTLGVKEFELNNLPQNLPYRLYDTIGRLVDSGMTNNFPVGKYNNQLLILHIEGYKPKKFISN